MLRWSWVLGVLCLSISCAGESRQTSRLGESCEKRTDCAVGLAGVEGTAAERAFGLARTSKVCEQVGCHEDSDCCGTTCELYRDECAAGNDVACEQVDAACDCGIECQDGACVPTCSETRP